MRRCRNFSMVETIYEADEEGEEEEGGVDNCSYSPSSLSLSPSTLLSPHLSSSSPFTPPPSSPLQAMVDYWTRSTGKMSDIIIRVCGRSFHLHGEPLSSRSRYLKRRLAEASDVTISPPLTITAEAFTSVARFCYGGSLALTQSNVAAIRIAAELLEMDVDGGGIIWQTEVFFRQEVAGNERNAAAVLRECIGMVLAAGEPAASLAARCAIELSATEEVIGVGGGDWNGELVALPAEVFRLIAESWAQWSFHDHDSLYRIADQFFERNKEKLSEEDKMKICSTINCSSLSQKTLFHLIKNPALPLRFFLQASLLCLLEPHRCSSLQAHNATASLRIESLERDVAGLRRQLRWSEEKRVEMDLVRSGSLRIDDSCANRDAIAPPQLPIRKGRGLRQKLVDGFRSIFRP